MSTVPFKIPLEAPQVETFLHLDRPDMAAGDASEEEVRRCRQNALPGLSPHQRYLRNVAPPPSEEEEEHGLHSHGLTRGHIDNKRKKLWLKEAESKKKRAPRLFPRFGGLGAFF